jgi:hypothetical protein
MSVAEIKKAIHDLPEKERQELLLHLADDIGDTFDIHEMNQAIQEGGSMPYDKFRK